MREHKYQVYVLRNQKMMNAISINLTFGGVWYRDEKGNEGFARDGYVLREFTGLKDKNDREIYEGDIIRRSFEVGREIIDPVSLGVTDFEIEKSGYFIGKVCYRPSEGYVLNSCKKYNDEDELIEKRSGVKIYAQYAEVIGNVYENSELLEGSAA